MALFGFLGGKKTSVGLDIGSGIIKVAVIDHSGSEAELVKVATTEVAADAIVEGEVMDPGIVAEAIRGLFSTAGVKQRSVVTAVGGRDVIVKKIQMDRMKEGDAREVIRWEAEQHVPLDMANVELDFQILDPDAGPLGGHAAVPRGPATRERTVRGGCRAGDPGADAKRGLGALRRGARRGDRGGGGAGGRVPRDRFALGRGAGPRVHDRRGGADSGAERGARESPQSPRGGREPGAAAQGAGRGVRVGGGGRGGPAADAVGRSGAEARRMIEINLLPGKKKRAGAAGAGFKLALPDFRGLIATIKNPWLIAATVTSAVVIVGAVLLFFTQTARLRVAEARLDAARAEKRRFDAVIAQKRQSERIRDSLVAEINIIRGIDADRYIWPHILDQVTKALPPYTWLTGVSAQGVGTGQAGAAPPPGSPAPGRPP